MILIISPDMSNQYLFMIIFCFDMQEQECIFIQTIMYKNQKYVINIIMRSKYVRGLEKSAHSLGKPIFLVTFCHSFFLRFLLEVTKNVFFVFLLHKINQILILNDKLNFVQGDFLFIATRYLLYKRKGAGCYITFETTQKIT